MTISEPVPIFCQRYRVRDAANNFGPWINFTGGSCTIELCDDGGFQDIQFDGGPNINTGWVWTDEDGNIDSEVDEIVLFTDIGLDDAGTYSGVYTSPDGCVSTLNFDVVVNALPSAPTVTTPVEYCIGDTAVSYTHLTLPTIYSV